MKCINKISLLSVFIISFVITIGDAYGRETGFGLKVSFADTVQKTSPAVVNIFTEKMVSSRSASPFVNDPFFSFFFDGALPGRLKQRLERSLGSGVIVTEDGYLITNHHVTKDAASIKVVFQDGVERDATFIAADQNLDIAVLKVKLPEGTTLPFIEFGDSDSLQVGDVVLALGNPFGVGQSVSMGIVSALGRSNLGTSRYENYIQTDAAVNPGNSGGALVDSEGRLMGINTAIFTGSGASQGVAFATPGNAVRVILNSVLKTGKITRPWFGANGQNVTPELAEQLGLSAPSGVLINDIAEDSPAAKANLKIGDIILDFAGFEVATAEQLNMRIAASYVGDNYPLKVWREGQEYAATVMLGALPDRPEHLQYTPRGAHPLSGYTMEPLSPALNDEWRLPLQQTGVGVVAVPTEGQFGMVDIRAGDVLVAINGREINTIKDVQLALSRRPEAWQIIYQRRGATHRVTIR